MFRLYTVVFLSGAALMGLEIAGSRIMAPVFGTSIFVWGALITTFLASLSTGYALGGKVADRRPSPALLGGILVDAAHQGRGVGRAAVLEAIRMLRDRTGAASFALSYDPDNTVAKGLYASLGFVETGDVDEDEVVARLPG